MRKKLFAIVMSMTMVASFMPSLAFAAVHDASDTYSIDNDCVTWSGSGADVTATVNKIKCSCGDVYTVSGIKVNVTPDKALVCGNGGERTFTANVVGNYNGKSVASTATKTVTVTLPATHDYEDIDAVPATCLKEGTAAHKKCKNCGNLRNANNTADVTANDLVISKGACSWEVADEYVTSDKLAADAPVVCSVCKKTGTVAEAADVSGTAGTAVVVKAATCDETGTNYTPYSYNAKVKTSAGTLADQTVVWKKAGTIAKATHNVVAGPTFVWNHDNHTCKVYFDYCENCGSNSDVVEATVTEVENVAATCTTKGSNKYKATVAGLEPVYEKKAGTLVTKDVPALGHDYVEHKAVAATCKEAGKTAYYQCSRCNDYGKLDENTNTVVTGGSAPTTVDAHHEMSATYAWPTDAEIKAAFTLPAVGATDAQIGSLKATATNIKCAACGLELKPSVAKEAAVKLDVSEFFRLNAGKSFCEDGYVIPVYVEDNTFDVNEGDVYASVDLSKYDTKKSTIPSETKSVTVAPVEHSYVALTTPVFEWDTTDSKDIKCSVVTKKCNATQGKLVFENNAYSYKPCDKVAEADAAKVTGTVKVEPTCTKNGEGTFTATYKFLATGKTISETKTLVLAKTDHKAEVIPAVAATVFATGSKDGVKCSVCGEILTEPKEVAKLKVGTAKISSLKAGKKSFTVKASAANATGYRVNYKKAGAKKYSYTTVKAKNLSKTVKKLSAGKKYTVKVKAYAKNYNGDGEVVWGALSSGKTVKVK